MINRLKQPQIGYIQINKNDKGNNKANKIIAVTKITNLINNSSCVNLNFLSTGVSTP